MSQKRRITLVTSSNFKMWAGGKKAALEYVKNLNPSLYESAILQPHQYWPATISDEELSEKLNGIELFEYSYPIDKLASVLKNQTIMKIISAPMLPFKYIIALYSRITNFRILHKIESESDIIYVVNNSLSDLFSNRSKIVGSEHIYLPGIENGKLVNSLYGKLSLKLTALGFLYRKINCFHCINEETAEVLKPNKDSFYVPNGVDTRYYPVRSNSRKIRFLFVGRLEINKGVRRLLAVFDHIKLEDYELHIVGRGSLEEEVKKHVSAKIIYHSFLTEQKLRILYRHCDVFVFPSKYESFGLVVLEALASGLYVITSDSLKPRFDDFEKAESLQYVALEDNSLKEAIEKIPYEIDSIRSWERKQNVHKKVIENYSWSDVTDRIFRIASEMCSSGE